MKKIAIILFVCIYSLSAAAQSVGIQFQHCSWAEAVTKAKAEKKLIFVDFYTQWCGPCYNMAKMVFSLYDVGSYYNANFVNMKIDAENGEGVALAKKYAVRSYPTYAFIDPNTQEMVHRSSSRQSPEQFILTGKNAQVETQRSFYLEKKFSEGNNERSFLIDYINYENSVYNRSAVRTAFDRLIGTGAKLTDKEVWDIYVNTISGMDNPYLKQVSDNYTKFCQLFGKQAVDAKLAKETTYGEPKDIEALCNFEGKQFNCKMIRINKLLYTDKNYDEVAKLVDAMLADPNTDKQKLIERLKYIARVDYYHANLPEKWFNKCIGYLQYIAYNQADRDEAYIHQTYAAALEMVLKKMDGKTAIPECLKGTPKYGKAEYNLRPDDLKKKPVRSKK